MKRSKITRPEAAPAQTTQPETAPPKTSQQKPGSNATAQMLGQIIGPHISQSRTDTSQADTSSQSQINQPPSDSKSAQSQASASHASTPHIPSAQNATTQPEGNTHTSSAGYQLQMLLREEPGKRTFLATDVRSQTQVVIKLLLYCEDPEDEALVEETRSEKTSATKIPTEQTQTTELSTKHLNRTESNTLNTFKQGDKSPDSSDLLPYLESFEVDTPLGTALALVKPYTAPIATHLRRTKASKQNRRTVSLSARNGIASAHKDLYKSTNQKVTRTPRLTFANFKIRSRPETLEVYCRESHIREGLISTDANSTWSNTVEIWLLIILGTLLFVGGTVAITSSIFWGIVVAAILPIVFHKFIFPHPKSRKKAIIRLRSASGGRTFVSLTTMLMPRRSRAGLANGRPTESTLHCSRMSIKHIKIEPALFFSPGVNPFAAQIVFTFHNHNACGDNHLRLIGSYQEMRWLSYQLSKWGNARNKDQ